jgi:hypothetical protein
MKLIPKLNVIPLYGYVVIYYKIDWNISMSIDTAKLGPA